MTRAILISGDEQRFRTGIDTFADFLADESQLRQITTIYAGRLKPQQLIESMADVVREQPDETTLVCYNGHGDNDCWATSPYHAVPYKRLVPHLSVMQAPLMLINDCCHAGTIIPHFEKQSWTAPVGLLTACPADETSYGFGKHIIECWAQRISFDPVHFPIHYLGLIELLGVEETTVGGRRAVLRYHWSRLMHKLNPERYPIQYLQKIARMLPPTQPSPPEQIIYEDRPRWGEVLDHLFFPPHKPTQLAFEF